ncbi:MAG: RDD family protein [Syntrophobacteraceae bacterium]
MRIECPKCGHGGQVEDAKFPDKGANILCPRCKEKFFVSKQTAGHASPLANVKAGSAPDEPLRMGEPLSPVSKKPPIGDPYSPGGDDPLRIGGRAHQSSDGDDPIVQEKCSQCGNMRSKEIMIRFGDKWVCAPCKPVYLQSLQQGLSQPGEMRYGGFWIRFGARIIDSLILQAASFVIFFCIGVLLAFAAEPKTASSFGMNAIEITFGIFASAFYEVFFIGRYRATPGKMVCRLIVVTPDGGNVSYMRALGRCLAETLSAIILCIGYIMAAFDQEKRALHDRICDTRVVYR